MAEIRPPTEQEKEALLKQLGDPITFFLVCSIAENMRQDNLDSFDIWENRFSEWKFLTRRLLWHFGLFQVIEHLYRLYEINADEYWASWTPPQEQQEKEVSIDPNAILLKDKVKITDIARKYGLKVKGNKAVCPFHNDTNPSLTLSDSKGVFRCFGCQAKGDIIKFVQMLEDVKNK